MKQDRYQNTSLSAKSVVRKCLLYEDLFVQTIIGIYVAARGVFIVSDRLHCKLNIRLLKLKRETNANNKAYSIYH